MAKAPTITKVKTSAQINAQKLRIYEKLNAQYDAKRKAVKKTVFAKYGQNQTGWTVARRVLRDTYRKFDGRTKTIARAAQSASTNANQNARYIKAWATRVAKYGPAGSGKTAGKKK